MNAKKSSVCNLLKDVASLEQILEMTESTAKEEKLTAKEAGRLRLLSEELVCMLPDLLEFSTGTFWIENTDKSFELHVALTPDGDLTADVRERLLAVSKSGKNAAATGILAKIKLAAQFMLIDYDEIAQTNLMYISDGMCTHDFFITPAWALSIYRGKVPAAQNGDWDELEMSIIAKIADDVIVGMQGKRVDIIVKKSF